MERSIPGCVGALVYSEARPRQWAIMYHVGQSAGRRAFTVGHELGHYVLHRELIEEDASFDGGIYCDENAIVRRNGSGIEQEADEFAAALLMPFHDFHRQLPAKQRTDFDTLSRLAKRYRVSLTAAVLRWLEYTETRAIMVVSNEGFAHWAKPNAPALKSGRYIRTKNTSCPDKLLRRARIILMLLSPASCSRRTFGFPSRCSKCAFALIDTIRRSPCCSSKQMAPAFRRKSKRPMCSISLSEADSCQFGKRCHRLWACNCRLVVTAFGPLTAVLVCISNLRFQIER